MKLWLLAIVVVLLLLAVLIIDTQEQELKRLHDAYIECMNKKGWPNP